MKVKYIFLAIAIFLIPIAVIVFKPSSHVDSTQSPLTKLLSAQLVNQNHADWDVVFYNPGKPSSSDDEILPMPCGGKMVFRKVETESDGLYGDQAIRIGDANVEEDRYKSNPVKAYIAGSFESSAKGRRYLLMGKYEITQLQYASIMKDASAACPEPSEDSALPQTGVNWFEAIEFSKRYSLWLQQDYLKDSSVNLPKKDKELGFVRLPTEIEWEFAARGGLLTKSTADYLQSTFFPISEANQYAWYSSSESANGKPHKIGKLKPNPLGIYDILGNADEIVFDLFHLSHQRADHLHGETGGYIVRGGSYLDAVGKIYSARREEKPFFANGELYPSGGMTGFRVVVAAPVITSSNAGQLPLAWQNLSSTSTLASTTPAEQPYAIVSNLSKETNDTALKNKLNEVSAQLNSQKAKYDEQLNRAAREALRVSAVLCQKLSDDRKNLERKQYAYKGFNCQQETTENKEQCAKINLKENEHFNEINKQIYTDSLINLASFGIPIISAQKEYLVQDMLKKEFTHLKSYLDILYPHVEKYAENGKIEINKWYNDCVGEKQ